MKITSVIPPGGSVAPLVGQQYEFLPFNAVVEFAVICAPGDTVEANLASGTDILMQNAPIDEKAATAPIVYPEDYQVVDAVLRGERLGLILRNTGASPATVRTVVRVTPQ